jgi:myosin heavy subunit
MENITAGNEAQGIEDMIHLDTMSEETILKNLGVRYSRDQIYVRTSNLEQTTNLLTNAPFSR